MGTEKGQSLPSESPVHLSLIPQGTGHLSSEKCSYLPDPAPSSSTRSHSTVRLPSGAASLRMGQALPRRQTGPPPRRFTRALFPPCSLWNGRGWGAGLAHRGRSGVQA